MIKGIFRTVKKLCIPILFTVRNKRLWSIQIKEENKKKTMAIRQVL